MIDIRPFASLGHADHGWLDARHHFSFANYHDPDRMGWGRIRVWNDDTIAAKSGFPPHPHRDMEIVTYVRTGAITHQDSLGNKGRTAAGDVQVMSAGTGVTHAEFNLEDEDTTLFQIWIETDRPGAQPGWGAKPFPKDARDGQFQLLASGDADDGALTHQRRRANPRRDGQGGRARSSSTPRPTATSIWSRAAGCGSMASRPKPATASPSPARTRCGSRPRTTPSWCWSTPPRPARFDLRSSKLCLKSLGLRAMRHRRAPEGCAIQR